MQSALIYSTEVGLGFVGLGIRVRVGVVVRIRIRAGLSTFENCLGEEPKKFAVLFASASVKLCIVF